jgi:glucokinase
VAQNGGTASGWVPGVDIGGTFIKGTLLDPEGRVRADAQRETPDRGEVDQTVGVVAEIVSELLAQLPTGATAAALGVAVPGAIDPDGGVVREASNLGWREVPLAHLLATRTGLPVFVEHDVRAAALAELIAGGGPSGDFLFLTLGTGVGGALVLGGQVYAGSHNLAGEIGHMIIAPGGLRCTCGKQGCLETLASASAVVRRVRQAGGYGKDLTGLQVGELVLQGDPAASAVWQEAADALGLALANCTVLLDPGRIVIGGGLAEAGNLLLAPVRRAMAGYLDPMYQVTVQGSALGAAAGRIGAALVARRCLQQ